MNWRRRSTKRGIIQKEIGQSVVLVARDTGCRVRVLVWRSVSGVVHEGLLREEGIHAATVTMLLGSLKGFSSVTGL